MNQRKEATKSRAQAEASPTSRGRKCGATEREGLSHLDAAGRLRMVDVSDKRHSPRIAVAGARVRMRAETLDAIVGGEVPKGDVLACARVAGISAAKRTAELIPLCHPLALSWVDVQVRVPTSEESSSPEAAELWLEATAKVQDATGVEMEALTAVSVAALTIYDMCKAMDPALVIAEVRLLEKRGGKSDFHAEEVTP